MSLAIGLALHHLHIFGASALSGCLKDAICIVWQVAGGIEAHSMSSLLKLACSMSVLLFVIFIVLYSDSSFITLSTQASFACPICPSFCHIWYSVLDVVHNCHLDMGLSQDCQTDLCCV